MRRVRMAIALLAAVGLLAGCGGGAPPAAAEHPAAARARQLAEAQQKKTAARPKVEVEVVTNERWDLIAEHFDRFTLRPVSTHKDIFKSNLDKFVEIPELPPEVGGTPGVDETPMPQGKEDTPPLKRFAADEFKAVIVMTGTAVPKALLADPKGGTHIVTVDDEVGNEDGVVLSITQHEVVIKHSDPKPVRLSVVPQLFEIGDRQEREREVFEKED